MGKKDYWDLTDRPHTKLKLEIYEKYLNSWCTIFKKQPWAKDIYIVDCFAGKGMYKQRDDFIDGSPLITVKIAKKFQEIFKNENRNDKEYFKIKCFFIEKDKSLITDLKKSLLPYSRDVDFEIIHRDFNDAIFDVLKKIKNRPTLFFIDPFGIKEVSKKSILAIVNKPGAKDILFNYINEGVVRIAGLAKKCLKKDMKDITIKELKTIKHLHNFIGDKFLKLIDKNDLEILKYYVKNILKKSDKDSQSNDGLEVIAFNMPYPHKSDTIYYLLFASRNPNAIKIVSQVYAKGKEDGLKGQKSLFGPKEQLKLHKDFKI